MEGFGPPSPAALSRASVVSDSSVQAHRLVLGGYGWRPVLVVGGTASAGVVRVLRHPPVRVLQARIVRGLARGR